MRAENDDWCPASKTSSENVVYLNQIKSCDVSFELLLEDLFDFDRTLLAETVVGSWFLPVW